MQSWLFFLFHCDHSSGVRFWTSSSSLSPSPFLSSLPARTNTIIWVSTHLSNLCSSEAWSGSDSVSINWVSNMMELGDNQLDFSQPLLTVRRISPAVVPAETRVNRRIDRTTANLPPLPRYKSELKSGPIRNPGTVPFVWEQSPGRPKDEGKSLHPTLIPRVAPPKPPPGKNPKEQVSSKTNQEVESDREKNSTPVDRSTLKCERVDDFAEEKPDSGSEIDDDAFLDALETFSRSESQCLSCSFSGLSVGDGLEDSRLSGRFSKEPPARDFMMGRFLPAAKAMASEAPANVSRKPRVEKDRPIHLTNALNKGNNNTQQYQRKLNVRFVNDRYGLGVESEGDFDEYETSSANMCGLLPRFCLSNAVSSFGVPSARSAYPMRRIRVRSSNARQDDNLISMRKSTGNRLKVEQNAEISEPKAITGHAISERDGKILEATTIYKLMQSGEAAKLRDDSSQTKPVWMDNSVKTSEMSENFVTEKPCKRQERQGMNFRQLLASEGSEWESGSKVPEVRKAGFIDAIQIVESQDSDTSTSDSRVVTESSTDDCDEEKNTVTRKSTDDEASMRSSVGEVTSLNLTQKSAAPSAGTANSAESSTSPVSEAVDYKIAADVVSGSKRKESSSKLPEAEATTSVEDEKKSPETIPSMDEKIDLEGEINQNPGDPLVIPGIYADFPIPPPLPKSPSDSWLSRTLPSMLSKNSAQVPSFAANAFGKVHPTPKPVPIDPKWETIVKTSNIVRGHLRFSEELLAPIPESCAAEH